VFIKRFRFYPQLEKISNKVRVATETLQLTDFIYGEVKLSNDTKEFLVEQKERSDYDLVGFTEHYGSIDFGHYVAACKDQTTDKWVLFNDERTGSIDPKKHILTDQEDLYVMMFKNKA